MLSSGYKAIKERHDNGSNRSIMADLTFCYAELKMQAITCKEKNHSVVMW